MRGTVEKVSGNASEGLFFFRKEEVLFFFQPSHFSPWLKCDSFGCFFCQRGRKCVFPSSLCFRSSENVDGHSSEIPMRTSQKEQKVLSPSNEGPTHAISHRALRCHFPSWCWSSFGFDLCGSTCTGHTSNTCGMRQCNTVLSNSFHFPLKVTVWQRKRYPTFVPRRCPSPVVHGFSAQSLVNTGCSQEARAMYKYWQKGDLRKSVDRQRQRHKKHKHTGLCSKARFLFASHVLQALKNLGGPFFRFFSAGDELFCARTRDGHCHV